MDSTWIQLFPRNFGTSSNYSEAPLEMDGAVASVCASLIGIGVMVLKLCETSVCM